MTEGPAPATRKPMTEDEIRAAWVVEPPRPSRQVQLVDYDPAWPRLFQRELASRSWEYIQNYADAKTAVVEAIIARAAAQRGGG